MIINTSSKAAELSSFVLKHFSNIASEYAASQNEDFYRNIACLLYGEISNIEIDVRNILEIGSGTGAATEVLRRNFPDSFIDCIEPSRPMVEVFQQKGLDRSGVRMIGMQPTRDSYDLVFSSMSLHWMDGPSECLAGIISRLAPGGIAAFSVPVKGARLNEAGNRMIYETFTELKKQNVKMLREPQWRGLSIQKLAKDLGEFNLNVKTKAIVEKINADKFVETLYVRGALLSFFGDQQFLAADTIQRKVEHLIQLESIKKSVHAGQPTINYAWPLAFLLIGK